MFFGRFTCVFWTFYLRELLFLLLGCQKEVGDPENVLKKQYVLIAIV